MLFRSWGCLVPTRRRSGTPAIIMATSVIDELDRLAERNDTTHRARSARKAVARLIQSGEAYRYGEANDSFSDNLFQAVFTHLRLEYRLILITQDRSLARDVLSLNTSSSVDRIHGIDAFRIDDRGYPGAGRSHPVIQDQ